MKRILQLWIISISLITQAQTSVKDEKADSIEVQMVKLPDSTAVGTPVGKRVSKQIGSSGGTIVSDDGKVELIIPADALTKATEISIQPITNTIPNSNKSYQFEPSGIQFKKALQIIFHYNDQEAETCRPELKFMALQDHKGKWEYVDYDDWDSTTKSLKGYITHFSAFADGNLVELNSTEITLKVGETHQFALNVVQPPTNEDDIAPLPITITKGNREFLWKVNGLMNGSTKYGTIVSIKGQAIKAIYTAPAKLTMDAITVKLELNDVSTEQIIERAGRRRRTNFVTHRSTAATFTCKVNLFDEYKVTVGLNMKVDGGQMTDTSTFSLKIGIKDRVSISNIQNQLAKVYIRQDRCKAIYANEATCVGVINVTGVKTSNLTAMDDGFIMVDVFFQPALMIFPQIHFPPCGANRVSNTTPPMIGQAAYPTWLHFEAKNEKQYISVAKELGKVVRQPGPEDVIATIEPVRK